ncbi:hypothetical protein [Pantoea sp. FN0307]|uniref:hypothetical protein n=1 Tax=Pantoea sp. FN0307 TaxID=3418560 RepID=UPI003CF7C0F0
MDEFQPYFANSLLMIGHQAFATHTKIRIRHKTTSSADQPLNPDALFVYAAPPVLALGRYTAPSLFSLSCVEENYLRVLNAEFTRHRMDWQAQLDDTYSYIDEIKLKAQAIICAPGLQYQFMTAGFPKERIISITTMEYFHQETDRVLKFLRDLDLQDVTA